MRHAPGGPVAHQRRHLTQQLATFLAATSGTTSVCAAARVGIERAAETLDAEIGEFRYGATAATVGFPEGRVPGDLLTLAATEAAGARDATIDLPGVGRCHVVVTPVTGRAAGHLLLARTWQPFSQDECDLVWAMARVLSLTLDMISTIEAERTLREYSERQASENQQLVRSLRRRQRLLEALSAIEHAIARRAPLQSILDTITDSARHLLGFDLALLRLIDPTDPGHLLLVSAAGPQDLLDAQRWRLPVVEARASELAISRNDVVTVPFTLDDPDQVGQAHPDQTGTTIAAPVHEDSTVVGCLLVATAADPPDRDGDGDEHQTLRTFAEHVSIALTDARTVQAMHEAFHDALTGLASRALFLDRLERHLTSDSFPRQMGLLFIDLNRFKIVNDTLGHPAGDRLLVDVAHRITEALRGCDTAARFGGDEFAVLLVDVTRDEAVAVAERLVEAIRAPYSIEGRQVFVNASVGICLGSAPQTAHELLRNADVAMYRAKRSGEGCLEVFEPAMHAELMERMQLESDLRRAVDEAGLTVCYQPIVQLDTGEVKGFEALARWTRPGRGPVSPADFIPISEETGLILPIGRWVLNEACQQISLWQREMPGLPPLTMSVNLSARQLRHPGLLDDLREVLASSGHPAHLLTLEITESLLHQDVDEAVSRLNEIKDLGVRLAIDDFGTGYSSLSCLHRFPVDVMKIDKSFVNGLTTGTKPAAFAMAIVRLGQMLDLETVAEGIETTVQLERLRGAGCPFGQGYLFARPLDPSQAGAYLLDVQRRLTVAADRVG